MAVLTAGEGNKIFVFYKYRQHFKYYLLPFSLNYQNSTLPGRLKKKKKKGCSKDKTSVAKCPFLI